MLPVALLFLRILPSRGEQAAQWPATSLTPLDICLRKRTVSRAFSFSNITPFYALPLLSTHDRWAVGGYYDHLHIALPYRDSTFNTQAGAASAHQPASPCNSASEGRGSRPLPTPESADAAHTFSAPAHPRWRATRHATTRRTGVLRAHTAPRRRSLPAAHLGPGTPWDRKTHRRVATPPTTTPPATTCHLALPSHMPASTALPLPRMPCLPAASPFHRR